GAAGPAFDEIEDLGEAFVAEDDLVDLLIGGGRGDECGGGGLGGRAGGGRGEFDGNVLGVERCGGEAGEGDKGKGAALEKGGGVRGEEAHVEQDDAVGCVEATKVAEKSRAGQWKVAGGAKVLRGGQKSRRSGGTGGRGPCWRKSRGPDQAAGRTGVSARAASKA